MWYHRRVGKTQCAHVFYSITRQLERPFTLKTVEIKVDHRRNQQRDYLRERQAANHRSELKGGSIAIIYEYNN